jgi:hypothetical protein
MCFISHLAKMGEIAWPEGAVAGAVATDLRLSPLLLYCTGSGEYSRDNPQPIYANELIWYATKYQ